jgi:hypothetical protein
MNPSSDPEREAPETRSYDFAHWISYCLKNPAARALQMPDVEFVEHLAGLQPAKNYPSHNLFRTLEALNILVRPEMARTLDEIGTETLSPEPQINFLNRRVTGLTLAALAGLFPPDGRRELIDRAKYPGLLDAALLGGLDASTVPLHELLAGENPYMVPFLAALAHEPAQPRKYIRTAIQPRNASNLGGVAAVGDLANLPFIEFLLERPEALTARSRPLTPTSDEFPLQPTTAGEYILYLASCLRRSCVPFLQAVARHPVCWGVPVSWREEWEAGNDEEDLELPFGLAAVMATSVSTFLAKFPEGPGGEEWESAVRTVVRGSLENWPDPVKAARGIAEEPRLRGPLRDIRLSAEELLDIATGIRCRRGLNPKDGEWPAEPLL